MLAEFGYTNPKYSVLQGQFISILQTALAFADNFLLPIEKCAEMCYSAIQGYGNEGNGRLKETFYPKMFPSEVQYICKNDRSIAGFVSI